MSIDKYNTGLIIGEFGNVFNGVIGQQAEGNAVDLKNLPHISIIVDAFEDDNGEKGAEKQVTINYETSADGVHWTFCGIITEKLPQGSATKAHVFETVGARYARLVRDDTDGGDAYVEGTIQAKP